MYKKFQNKRPLGFIVNAVRNDIVLSWEPVKDALGYIVFEKKEDEKYHVIKKEKLCYCLLGKKEKGKSYQYYICAYKRKKNNKMIYSKPSKKKSVMVSMLGISTIKNFLQIALSPVGSTMYVWGGGWNKADAAAGMETKSIGLSARWRRFAYSKKSSYQYKDYQYQIHDGLDCSGYVGWCIYNVLHMENEKNGYVFNASKQAKLYSDLKFGQYIEARSVKSYQAGDIMSSTCKCCSHVWIVIGMCLDGSVVLLHSSPAGVQISGTQTREGRNGEACQLARKYMKKYYRKWYRRFPKVERDYRYLFHYAQMKWRTMGEDVILSDPDGYRFMDAESILKDIFRKI